MRTLAHFFKAATLFSLLGWAVLFGFPLWPEQGRTLTLTVAVGLLCALYVYLVFLGRHHDEPGSRVRGHFFSLDGVIRLFQSPRVVLAGWVHYLAFDLMVGLYIVSDAPAHNLPHLWLLPALFLTLMFGPAGLLLYALMRALLG